MEGPLTATFSSVLAVRLPGGLAAVAKRSPPAAEARHEADALRAWDGAGAVHLLDEIDGVLLLERAEPGRPVTDDAALARGVARLWIEPPTGVEWRRADDLVARWRATVLRCRAALGARVADAADAVFADGLGDGPRRLLHGDGHHGNVLDGGPGRGWLAIDPQPLVGPAALDLVPALHNGPHDAARRRVDRLAGEAGVDVAELCRLAPAGLALRAAWALDDGRSSAVAARALAVAAELLD